MSEDQTINLEQTFFDIIHTGIARSKTIVAAELEETRNFGGVDSTLVEAEAEQAEAHKVHARLIQMDPGGEQVPFSVLQVHSKVLLMRA